MLCIQDGHTRECLTIEVGKALRSQDAILALSRLMRIYEMAFPRHDGHFRKVFNDCDVFAS